jgi:hypothetical protein
LLKNFPFGFYALAVRLLWKEGYSANPLGKDRDVSNQNPKALKDKRIPLASLNYIPFLTGED